MVEIPGWTIPLVAAIGGLIGALVPLRVWRKNDRADRRRQAVPALAATRDLVDRLPPDSWAINANPTSMERWEEVRTQWLGLRPAVVAIRSLFPEQEDDVEVLCITVDNLIVEVGWLVKGVLEHSDFRDWRDRANTSQSTAKASINALMRSVGKA